MANTYTNIASNTLGSSSSLVTFNNIQQTYTDLVIRMSVRSTNGYSGKMDQLKVWFNNDASSALLSQTIFQSDSAAATSARNGPNGNEIFYLFISSSGSTANTFGSTELYIPRYTSSTSKPISTFSAQEDSSGTPVYMGITASLYRNTSAITRIDIASYNSMTLNAGSSFYLYGVKNS